MHSSLLKKARAALPGVLTLVLATGCASAPSPEPPTAADGPTDARADAQAAAAAAVAGRDDDQALVHALDTELITPGRHAAIRATDRVEDPLPDRLVRVASDPAAPPLARGNALLLLGEFGAAAHLQAFGLGVRDQDARVRAAAATALGGLLEERPAAVVGLLEIALRDPEEWVQARALQSLGDQDLDVLRAYLPRAASPELAGIARSLLRVAEERGAPLADTGSDGVLSRLSAGGHRVLFRPERSWHEGAVAVGELVVVRPSGDTLRVASGVEAAGNVVPAFFSPDERWLVYEAERRIHVLDLESGARREVGEGVAPRPLPFSAEYVFMRPTARPVATSRGAAIPYDVIRARFAGEGAEVLGSLHAQIERGGDVGNVSPVRLMRVREREERFYLEGPGLQRFALPDPFGRAGG